MECPHIPELEYSDFGQRLSKKIAGQRLPLSGSLELTFRCNLRCQHCYVSHGHQGIPGQKEMTTSEIRNILDQLVDEGCLWLLLTGGEPMIRRDFLDIYTYAKRIGLLLTLFTNGSMLTPRLADALVELRPFKIEITLYGRTQETYEHVTGIPGSYGRCMRGIELLLERNLPLRLKTMVMTLNQHEVGDMRAFAESLGVNFRFDPMLNAGLGENAKPASFRIPVEDVIQFDVNDPNRLTEWQEFCERFVGPRNTNDGNLYNCGAGKTSFHIDPYGKLSVCIISRTHGYDLRRGCFQEGWREFIPNVLNQPAPASYSCNKCELLALCGQCPGWAQLEHGVEEQAVEYLCQVAHSRAEAFGLDRYIQQHNLNHKEAAI